MKKATEFSAPCAFTGTYLGDWAGYIFLQLTQQNAYHPGIDWNWGWGEQDNGMPVQAVANGIVVHTSDQAGIGYGKIVVVKHELSDELIKFIKERYGIDTKVLYSFYAHLSGVNVSEGQEVSRGDLIAWIGKSGTEASHLHQELYKPVPGTTWRYWPTLSSGWTVEKLKQYYIDTFDLIQNQPKEGTAMVEVDPNVYPILIDKCNNRDQMWEYLGLPKDPVEKIIDKAKAVVEGFKNVATGFQRQLAEALAEVSNRKEQVDRIKQTYEASATTDKERISALEKAQIAWEKERESLKGQVDEFAKGKGTLTIELESTKTKLVQEQKKSGSTLSVNQLVSFFIAKLWPIK